MVDQLNRRRDIGWRENKAVRKQYASARVINAGVWFIRALTLVVVCRWAYVLWNI